MGGIGCGPGAAPAIARARVRAASSCARQLNRRDRLGSRRRTCTWRRPVPQVLPPMYSHRGKRRSAGATSRASRGFSPLGQPSGRFFAIPVRANSYRPHISTCSLLRSPGRLGLGQRERRAFSFSCGFAEGAALSDHVRGDHAWKNPRNGGDVQRSFGSDRGPTTNRRDRWHQRPRIPASNLPQSFPSGCARRSRPFHLRAQSSPPQRSFRGMASPSG
jgi:hypothetical protein